MLNKAWGHLYLHFSEQEKVLESFSSEELTGLLTSLLHPFDTSIDVEVDSPELTQDEQLLEVTACFTNIQTKLSNNLTLCRENLSPLIKESELNNLMQALIFLCDELVLTKTLNQVVSKIACECEPRLHSPTFAIKAAWPTMQSTLLQCRDGGERFFFQVEALLNQPADNALAIEVYYFCLKQGFLGEYVDKPDEIDKLLIKLAKAISNNRSAYIPPTNAESILKDEREPTIGDEYASSP